jgi:uncharacterized protein YqgV (UPF0045/DUF77 family)
MKEVLLRERYENVDASVRHALKQMQTDGLALQLEEHQTSSPFAAQRLTEVLRDHIDAGREKFIQRLLHEINDIDSELDKSRIRHQKLQSHISYQDQMIASETRRLTEHKQSISTQIHELQQEHTSTLARQEKSITLRTNQIRQTRSLLGKSRITLTTLSTDLSELRTELSLASVSGCRSLRSAMQRITDVSLQLIAQRRDSITRKATRVIAAKQIEIDQRKSKCATLRSSIESATQYVNELARAMSLPGRAAEPGGFRSVLESVFVAEQKEVVQQQLRSAEVGQKTFVRSAKDDFDQKLGDKQAELDRIIQTARKTRLKLQSELDAALEQIRRLQGSWADDDDIESSLEDSMQYNFESSTRQLDETLGQLGLRRQRK